SGFLATVAIVSSYLTSPFLAWVATQWVAPAVGWRAMIQPCGRDPGPAGGTPPPRLRCRRSLRWTGRPAVGHGSHFALLSFCGYPLVRIGASLNRARCTLTFTVATGGPSAAATSS